MAFVDALCGAIMLSDPERFDRMLIQSTKEFEQDMHHKEDKMGKVFFGALLRRSFFYALPQKMT